MAVRPERVLAIDVDAQTVRGIVLASETPAVAGGYAQLNYESAQGPVAFAARIAAALDVKATLPVAVVCDATLGDAVAADVAAAIVAAGFAQVTVTSRTDAVHRANPAGGEPDSLDDVQIPSGLLTSHAGLTLADLAAVVGAGLGLLRGAVSARSSSEPKVDPPVAVWAPTSQAPPAPDTDPFTSAPTPIAKATATAATAAAAAAAMAAAANVGPDELDDDLTVAAPANRASAPTPDSGFDDLDDDLTVAAPLDRASAPRVEKSDGDSHAGFADELIDDDDVTGPVPTQAESTASVDESDDATASPAATERVDVDVDDATVNPDDVPVAVVDDDATVNPDDVPVAVADGDATVNPDDVPVAVVDGDATVNPDDMPAVATAAAAAVSEGNIDATVVMDRSALRAAAVADSRVAASAIATADDEPSSSNKPLLLALAVVALLVAGGLALSQCSGSDDDGTETSTVQADAVPTDAPVTDTSQTADPTVASEVEATAAPTEVPPVATATPEPVPEPTMPPTATAEPEPEATVDPLAGLAPLSSLPERGAVFRPPTLFLEGPVQTQEQADELYARAIAVVGPDNVVNNYIVRPDAPAALDGNVRVEQAVLFQSGSAVISEQFIPTLELGVAVMALNPQVQMVVEGHTDSVGSDESNLVLSQRRAEAVVAYLVSRGVDSERLQPLGLGEGSPVESNDTADGRQINRRIEVDLLDLLAGE